MRLDASGPHWLARHVVRSVVQVVPVFAVVFAVLVVFLPVSPALVALALVFALAFSLLLLIGSADVFCTGRLVRHGFPPETGPRYVPGGRSGHAP